MRARWIAAAMIVTAAGCGGSGAAEPQPAPAGEPAAGAEGEAAEAPPVVAPPEAWEQMSFDARKEHMKQHVLPVMKAKFQAHDPERFADFDCATCHGPDPAAGDFEMPSGDLPELPDPESMQFKQLWEGDSAPMAKFMSEQVEPTMADLLGLEPYDPETGEGFGCFACHTQGSAAGAGAGPDSTELAPSEPATPAAPQ